MHVQSGKPDDPALIATALTVTATPGIVVERIVYPEAEPFQQAGRAKPLAVRVCFAPARAAVEWLVNVRAR